MVADALNRMTIGTVSHVEESNKDLVKDIHRFDSLGVLLEDSLDGGFIVHRNSKSYLVVEVKYKKHFDQLLKNLKISVLSKLDESFSMEDDVLSNKVGCVCRMWII